MASDISMNFFEVQPKVLIEFLKEKGFTPYYGDDWFFMHCKKDGVDPIMFKKQGMVSKEIVRGIFATVSKDPKKDLIRLSELQTKNGKSSEN